MTQHSSLSVERWSAFSKDQQILSIAAEMNRAGQLLAPEDRPRLRDLIAALSLSTEPSAQDHAAAFRCLLQFTPEAARQIPDLLS